MSRPIRAVASLAPAALFGVASLSADLVAIVGHDPIGIWRLLPFGPVGGSWVNAEVSSTALFVVGIGLARAKRIGWWLAVVLLVAGTIAQGVAFHHHGLAIIVGVTGVATLVVTRRRYVARTGSMETSLAVMLLGAGAVAVLLDALTSGGLASRHAAWLFGSWLDAGRVGRLSLADGLGILLVMARVAFIAAAILALDPAADPRSVGERERARSVLRRRGAGALLPYQLGPMAEPVADASGDSALAYARAGRAAVVLGDTEASALDAFLDLCREEDWSPAVYQASARFAATLRARDWHAIRVGSEAILDPQAFALGRPRLANVRHTVTRARKGGLTVSTSRDGASGLPPEASPDRLADLDATWQRANGPRLGFTVGQFHPATLGGCVVAGAIDGSRHLEAFVVLRPTGSDGGWMLDVMRRRSGGVPGAMELCLVAAIEHLRSRGVRRLSLGLAPLAGLTPRSGPLDERLLAIAARLVRPAYDVEALAFFKGKFDPAWEPRYLAVPRPWSTLGAGMALVRLHLGGSWGAVVRSLGEPFRHRGRVIPLPAGVASPVAPGPRER